MTCSQFENYMMKHFDRESNDIENAKLKQHMKSCKVCRHEFGELEEIVDFLETDSSIEPPEDFEAQVMNKINTLDLKRRKKRNSAWMVHIYNIVTVACTALLLLTVARTKEVSLKDISGQVVNYFNSFPSFAESLYSLFSDTCHMVISIVDALHQICIIVFKSYAHVIIALIALLFAVQRTFLVLVNRDGGNKK